MAVRTQDELKQDFPIGGQRQSSVSDIHNLIDTLFARTPDNQAGQIEDASGEIRQPVNSASAALRHTLIRKAMYPRYLNELSIGVAQGTAFTVTLYINDVAVPGITSVSVSTTNNVYLATGLVTIPAGAKLTMGISGISTPSEQVLTWTLKTTRA